MSEVLILKNPEQNSNNAKGKAAVKQDLENTLTLPLPEKLSVNFSMIM